jgi:hypothetical protein
MHEGFPLSSPGLWHCLSTSGIPEDTEHVSLVRSIFWVQLTLNLCPHPPIQEHCSLSSSRTAINVEMANWPGSSFSRTDLMEHALAFKIASSIVCRSDAISSRLVSRSAYIWSVAKLECTASPAQVYSILETRCLPIYKKLKLDEYIYETRKRQ